MDLVYQWKALAYFILLIALDVARRKYMQFVFELVDDFYEKTCISYFEGATDEETGSSAHN